MHLDDIKIVGIVPIAMSDSTYDKAFSLYWKIKTTLENEIEGIDELSTVWDGLIKRDVFDIFNDYFRLLFETIVAGDAGKWDELQMPLSLEARNYTKNCSRFLRQLKKYYRLAKEREKTDNKTEPQITSKDTASDESEDDERKTESERVKIAMSRLEYLLEVIKEWFERFESREKEILSVADLFALKK